MATQAQRISLGSKGLNRDFPSYSLPTDFFDDGLNMRFKDGSIQACPRMLAKDNQPITGMNPIVATQYIPSGTTYINSVVTGLVASGQDYVLRTQFSTSGPTQGVVTIGYPTTLPVAPAYDPEYGIDSFVFNQLHILNTKNTVPLYFNANAQTNVYNELPNWIRTPYSTIHTQGVMITNVVKSTVDNSATLTLSMADADFLVGAYIATSASPAQTARITSVTGTSVSVDNGAGFTAGTQSTTAYLAFPYYARGLTHYQGRLIAFNLYITLPDPGIVDDRYSPIELAWSQPINAIQSLDNIVWTVSTTNSAGNDYITETPGEILGALTLGDYLMVYKNDSVYRTVDQGAPNYLVTEQLYDSDGILNGKCVTKLDSARQFVVGNRGVYITQGGIDSKNLSRNIMEESLFKGPDGIDLNYKGIAFVYHNVQEKEAWICYRHKQAAPVTDAGGVIGCTRAWCYQYLTETWYLRSLDNVTSIVDYQTGSVVDTISAKPGLTFAAKPSTLSYLPFPGIDPSSDIYEANCYATWRNRDLGTAAVVKNVNAVYPHCFGPIILELKLRNYIHTDTFPVSATQRPFNPNGDYRLDYRETGRYVNLRITAGLNGQIINNPRLNDVDVDVEMRGRR